MGSIIQVYEGKELTEYQLPDTWADVKLYQYCGLVEALKKEDLSRIEMIMRTIEHLTEMTIHQINRIPYKHMFKVYDHLTSLLNLKPNKDLVFKIEGKNKSYGFHPDLHNMTMGEFVDLETAVKDPYKNMAEVMAILYRTITDEEGDKYKIEDYKGTQEEDVEFMRNINMDIVHSASSFFLTLNVELQGSLTDSLEMLKMKIKTIGYETSLRKMKNLKKKL